MTNTLTTLQLTAMAMPFSVKLVTSDQAPLTEAQIAVLRANLTAFLTRLDREFSPFRADSWVRQFQRQALAVENFQAEFEEVYGLATRAQHVTHGAFNPYYRGVYDPTGLVKGWAIQRAFETYLQPLLSNERLVAAAINGAGDMQLGVADGASFTWHVGIEDPVDPQQLIWQYELQTGAIATSGTSQRGEHIVRQDETCSLQQATILATDLIEADVLATAAIAMGQADFLTFSQTYPTAGLLVDQTDQVTTIGGLTHA